MRAEDSLIERNQIILVPAPTEGPGGQPPDEDGDPDLGGDPIEIYAHPEPLLALHRIYRAYRFLEEAFAQPSALAYKALGGIKIGSGSVRIDLRENKIHGGAGDGITLGGLAGKAELVEIERATEQEHFIEAYDGIQVRVVDSNWEPIPKVWLNFRRAGHNAVDRGPTDTNGWMGPGLPGGKTFVTFAFIVGATGAYRINRIVLQDAEMSESPRYVVTLEEVETEPEVDQLLAFIYDVSIEGNQISHMGLSGIGVPRLTVTDSSGTVTDPDNVEALALKSDGPIYEDANDAVVFAPVESPLATPLALHLASDGSYVVGVAIRNNHIYSCLQNEFGPELRAISKRAGLGGISLGRSQDLTIQNNRIEENGVSHVDPVCGIFLSHGHNVDISHNYIANNGPLRGDVDPNAGWRGGIVIQSASPAYMSALHSHPTELPATSNIVARVHDNVVDQPLGRALTITALGPVSIVSNQFNTHRAAHTGGWDLAASAVFVLNYGGFWQGSFTANVKEQLLFALYARLHNIDKRWPPGSVLFNSNRTRFGGSKAVSFSSQFIQANDVGFSGNQSDMQEDVDQTDHDTQYFGRFNTVVWGLTVRASDSRFTEVTDNISYSLGTHGQLMNTTTLNQADHCIYASGPVTKLINADNLTIKECGPPSDDDQTKLDEQEVYVGTLVTEDGLNDLKTDQMADSLLVGHEEMWLAIENPDSLKDRMIAVDLNILRDLDLDVEAEIAEITIPEEISATDANIYGRVIRPDLRGIKDATVVAKDSDGRTVKTAPTGSSGDYDMSIPVEEIPDGGLTLTVTDDRGDMIYREPQLVKPVAGARTLVELKVPGGMRGVPPAPTDEPSVEQPGAERPGAEQPPREERPGAARRGGRPGSRRERAPELRVEEIKGIGPKSAEKLEVAGIKTIQQFLAAPNKKLGEILGFGGRTIRRLREAAEERLNQG